MSGEVTGTDTGDSVKVWFTGGGADERLVHLHGRVRHAAGRVLILAAEDYTGASPAQAGRDRAAVPLVLQGRADGQRHRVSTSTTSTPTAARRRTTSACSATTTPSSGTRATTSSPASRAGARATRRASRCRSCSRCATSSTRAGACSTRASGPVSSTRRRSARSSTTRSRTGSAAPTRPSWRAAWRCSAPATRRATRSSTCSVRRSRRAGGGSDPDTGDPFDVTGIDDPLDGLTWGFNGADSAQNQAIELVVHRDRRLPQGHRPGRQLPAVRELAGGRVPERPRGSVRPAHRAVVHVVANARTRRTSA